MRLITFATHGHARLGVILARDGQERVLDLSTAQPGLPADMVAFLSAGEAALVAARNVMASAAERDLLPIAEVTLLAPIPRPGKIVCLGHNYFDHMGIGKTEPPQFPTFFCKTANTVIGPGQAIVIPRVTSQVDYEAELAVVIGKRVKHVKLCQRRFFIADIFKS
jgi:2-keto-4-pentenoate hydratase/2-oxohepta-3-ene-1,7-dioic acid hydratase in catechol pathway